MRQVTYALVCALLLAAPAVVFAGNEIGPIKTSNNQTEICMVRCEGNLLYRDGANCDFEIKWVKKNGVVLLSSEFYNVPVDGSRELPYAGTQKLVSCRIDPIMEDETTCDTSHSGRPGEPSIAILDVKGYIAALMTNDRSESTPAPPISCDSACDACSDFCPPGKGADHGAVNEWASAENVIGPTKTNNNQTEVCMVKCGAPPMYGGHPAQGDESTCDFEIKWLKKNGSVLLSKEFYDVPFDGSRELPFAGTQKLVSCRIDPLNGGGGRLPPSMAGHPEEPSVAILDNKGNTMALMTNDRGLDAGPPRWVCPDACYMCNACQ